MTILSPFDKMFSMRTVAIVVLCIKVTVGHKIEIPIGSQQDPCLIKLLTSNIKCDESLILNWSHRIHDDVSDVTVLNENTKFVLRNWQLDPINKWQVYSRLTVVMVASTMTQIVDGMLSLRRANLWNSSSKFIIVYSDHRPLRKVRPNDPILKRIFRTFAIVKAFNVHMIYKSNERISEFTWFPYEDGNCDRVRRVRLISQCDYSFHRIFRVDKPKSTRCNVTVAVRSYKPYAIYTEDGGFAGGVDINVVREWARHGSEFNLEFKVADEAEVEEKYFTFR